jgi:hypothetical protein
MVFVDHRIELPSDETWRLLDQLSHGKEVEQLDRYDVGWVIANRKNQSGLVETLTEDTKWSVAHDDEWNVTFRRAASP